MGREEGEEGWMDVRFPFLSVIFLVLPFILLIFVTGEVSPGTLYPRSDLRIFSLSKT